MQILRQILLTEKKIMLRLFKVIFPDFLSKALCCHVLELYFRISTYLGLR